MAASSSMMSTDPAGAGLPFIVPREITAASDMDCLPAQGEIQGESGAGPGIALYANLARMFLDDAVRYGEAQTCAAILTFPGCRLRCKKRIVDSLNVFRRNPRSGVRDAHTYEFAVAGRDAQLAAARHGIFGIEEKIEKHLLKPARIPLYW